MAKAKEKDACKNCGHSKRYHANNLEHELGTTHCTRCDDDLKYCECKEYVGE